MLRGSNELEGERTPANVYIQTLDPVDSKPCLYFDDKIAGTVRQHANGRAWLLGTYIGHNGTAYRNENTREFVRALMKSCHVLPVSSGELLVRKRRIDRKAALVITNPTDHEVTEQLNIGGWTTATDLFDEPLEIDNQSIRLSVESLDVKIVLLSDPKGDEASLSRPR